MVLRPILIVALGSFYIHQATAKDLPLKRAIEQTLLNNPQMLNLIGQQKLLQSQVRSNKGLYDWGIQVGAEYADADQARVSVFQPSNIKSTDYSLNVVKSFTTATDLSIFSTINKTEDDSTFALLNNRYQTDLGISLQQELLEGFIGQPEGVRLETDRQRLEAQQFSLWRQMEVLISNISILYWTLWRNIQLEKVALQSQQEAKEFLDETQRLSKLGLRDNDEILQAEASLLLRDQEVITAKVGIENAWTQLQSQIDPDAQNWSLQIPEIENPSWGPSINEITITTTAYRNRGDFLAAQMILDVNQKIRESLKAQLWPRLTATGGYSLVGLDPELSKSIDQVEETRTKGWNIGMSLSHSFGQNFDQSRIDLADAELIQSQSDYNRQSEALNRETQLAVRNFKRDIELWEIAKSLEEKRAGIEKAFTNKYRNGRISTQDLIRAQEEHRRARYERQIAEANLATSQMNVYLAEGTYLSQMGYDIHSTLNILDQVSQ
jgi:outer membrane protein TolC